ncbi:helix-turn-helix domain-containing protein [Snodgrassella sp. CFCC 13594]|uniref:helix-turn-helix domain-containing protein n=1 Tax=Snodgrassella sp. CFCC 13594 TaxID=1775559 RepID=UPI001E4761A9
MAELKTYTVVEAAQICQCHAETIREKIRAGAIKAVKPGRKYCIRASDLDAFLQSLQNECVQASLERRSEQKCQFINERMEFGTLILSPKVVKELDEVLKPKRRGRHKNCTTKLPMNSGG